MRRIFNTANVLMFGIALATAGLFYIGMIWQCPEKNACAALENEFVIETVDPAA